MFLQLPFCKYEGLVELELRDEIANHTMAHAGLGAGVVRGLAPSFAKVMSEFAQISVDYIRRSVVCQRTSLDIEDGAAHGGQTNRAARLVFLFRLVLQRRDHLHVRKPGEQYGHPKQQRRAGKV